MKKDKVLGVIRHTLTFAGGLLMMRGYIEAQELQEITGAVVTAVGTVWSVVEKNKRN